MLLEVVYPGGEHTLATGYPREGSALIVDLIPRGPEAAYLDEVEVDLGAGPPYPVLRVLRGPRRPTIHVHVDLAQPELERWVRAREAEGWELRYAEEDSSELLVVAGRDGMDSAELERAGAKLVGNRRANALAGQPEGP